MSYEKMNIDRSVVTVRKWIEIDDLPAAKIGGSWISDTELIDEWRTKQCREANVGRWYPGRQS
jgi:hypothetical protein